MRLRTITTVPTIALLALVAACGSGEDQTTTTPAAQEPAGSAAQEPATADAEEPSSTDDAEPVPATEPPPTAAADRTASATQPSATRPAASSPAEAAGSCEVTPQIREALELKGVAPDVVNADDLTIRCSGDWARVRPSNPGEIVLRRQGDTWEWYTSFPTGMCRSEFIADGGPAEFDQGFRPC